MRRWIDWTEMRYALRLMRKQPVVAFTVILALAIGIGMATTGFTFMESVLFGELPFPGGDRYVRLTSYSEPEGDRTELGVERFRLLRDRATTLAFLGGLQVGQFNILHSSDEVENVNGAILSPGWFGFLPYRPVVGRLLIPEDGEPGSTPVVVIRESLWERHFGRDAAVLGSMVNVGGVDRAVVGVVSDACEFPASGEIWIPLEARRFSGSSGRSASLPALAGILAADVPLETARIQVGRLVSQFQAERPAADAVRVDLTPFTDLSALRLSTPLVVGIVFTILVLLLVASNVANLILARNAARTSELTVRAVLGAGRSRLIGQLVVEILMLGAVAAVLGLVASQIVLKFVDRSIEELPFWIEFTPSPRTVIFVVVMSLLATAVAGVWPAMRATRRDLAVGLRAGGSRTRAEGMGRLGSVMIVAETTMSVALLGAAVVFAWGFARYADQSVDLPRGKVLTAQVYIRPPAEGGPSTGQLETDAHTALLRAVREIPGIAAFGTASSLPRMSPRAEPIEFEPLPGEPSRSVAGVPQVGIRPGFLSALGGDAIGGRLFVDSDLDPGATAVAIVNPPFVETVLGGRNPIGRRFRVVSRNEELERPEWREIVGVVPDLGILVGDPDRAAGYYVPMRSRRLFYLALRSSGDPRELAGPLRRAIFRLDPEIVVNRVVPLEAVALEDRKAMLAMSSVLTAIGMAALGLSLVGMYAIMSLAVTSRTREIGIRVALGATRRQILESVLGRSGKLLSIGAVLGSGLAMVLMNLMDKFLVSQLPNPGVWVLPLIALFLGAAGFLAGWVPARRAVSIHPSEALSCDG